MLEVAVSLLGGGCVGAGRAIQSIWITAGSPSDTAQAITDQEYRGKQGWEECMMIHLDMVLGILGLMEEFMVVITRV